MDFQPELTSRVTVRLNTQTPMGMYLIKDKW